MTNPAPTNIAASVRQKLLNLARQSGRPYNELLLYYAIERFLYRVSQSSHVEHFVLKGALMLRIWGGPMARSTRDIDMLGMSKGSVEELIQVIGECMRVPVIDDGLRFDPASVRGEDIRVNTRYLGVRLRFLGYLGTARLSLQVDVGFGDAILPRPDWLEYPSMLDLARPRLMGYAPETTVAEKFHAMVELEAANSRLKDFYDLWFLAKNRVFEASVLAMALEATFKRRGTPLPSSLPFALTPAFYDAPDKRAQWRGFLRKLSLQWPTELAEATHVVELLMMPVVEMARTGGPLSGRWIPPGPWE